MEKIAQNCNTEMELMIAVKRGHHIAFEQLYKLHRDAVYRSMRKLTRDEDLAKEILQEVFLKIWEKKTELKPEQPFGAFLYMMARNRTMDFYRQLKREKQLIENLQVLSTEVSEQPLEQESIEEELLRSIIELLPPQRKKIFMLCKLENKSYEEVSKALGVSASTISDHIVKANKFLRSQLVDRMKFASIFFNPVLLESACNVFKKIISNYF